MSTKKSKKKKKSDSKYITGLFVCLVILFIVLISTIFGDCIKISENKKETKELNHYYENLLEEQASLNSEVVKLQDPEYVARYAREKYLYTKDGETILKIVDGQVVVQDDNEKDAE